MIGQGGATIKGIQDQTGARIDVDSSQHPATITISGTDEAIQAAGEIITGIVNPPTAVIECDQAQARAVIGSRGATVKDIQKQTGARIHVNTRDQPCTLSKR